MSGQSFLPNPPIRARANADCRDQIQRETPQARLAEDTSGRRIYPNKKSLQQRSRRRCLQLLDDVRIKACVADQALRVHVPSRPQSGFDRSIHRNPNSSSFRPAERDPVEAERNAKSRPAPVRSPATT
jgi:hypothetical protein